MTPPAKHNTLNVMIADDSSTIRLFIVNALRQSEYSLKLTEAADGGTCLEMLASGNFDVAFIDLNMPRMSGIEAVNRSRKLGVSTFIAIMSSQSDPAMLDMARELGAYEYFIKPFQAEDVLSIVRNYTQLTKPTSILLVDDSRAIRAVIHRVLENSLFNLDIEEAFDGSNGLSVYKARHHDIVFLDLNMPGISGSQTLTRLRQMNRQVQVVLITTPQSRKQVEALDPDSYAAVLYKPFYSADVDRVLHELYGLELPELRFTQPAETGNAAAEKTAKKSTKKNAEKTAETPDDDDVLFL